MQLALLLALIVGLTWGQELSNDSLDALKDLFPTANPVSTKCPPGQLCLPGFKVVSSTTTESSSGYIEKCGEGATKGRKLCVNYNYCNPTTLTIEQNGLTAGFGVIDIRIGENSCGHPLEVCCNIPEGGLSPGFDPNVAPTTTTPPPGVTTPSSATTARPVPSSRCGNRNNNGIDFKITGNSANEAEYGEFPWMVALVRKNLNPRDGESFSFCGGSLISPSVVLTATHCVFKYTAEEIKVRAGEWDSKTTRERLPYQERDVARIITHREFVRAGVFNDVALLILASPLDEAEHIGPVCLPTQGQVIQSRNCFVSGWGKNVFGTYLDILKKVELPIVPIPQCQTALRQTRLGPSFLIHDSFICAGGEKGKDACTGDGGSPLVCPDPNNPTRYLLTGMVAWGIGCGQTNVPGVYVDVAKFRSWIEDQLKRENINISSFVS